MHTHYTLHIQSPASRPLVAGAAYSEVAGPGPGTGAEQPSADHHSVSHNICCHAASRTPADQNITNICDQCSVAQSAAGKRDIYLHTLLVHCGH